MTSQSKALKRFCQFIVGLFSIFLWSFATSVLAQVPQNVPAPSLVQPRIQKMDAFNLDFNAAPSIPNGLERSSNPSEGSRGIIQTDDRVPMTSHRYPWSAIGRVEGLKVDGEGYICTGALITPEIVLTNAHCVYDPATHQASQFIRFMPNLVNGLLQDEDDAAFVTDAYAETDFSGNEAPPNPDDWALLKLEKSLGSKYGTIGLANLDAATLIADYQGKLVLPGYSFDFPTQHPSETAGVHLGCSIVNEVNGVIVHNCDTRGGSSGGPILAEVDGELRIVAVNSAEFANPETGVGLENYGIPITRVLATLQQQAAR